VTLTQLEKEGSKRTAGGEREAKKAPGVTEITQNRGVNCQRHTGLKEKKEWNEMGRNANIALAATWRARTRHGWESPRMKKKETTRHGVLWDECKTK